MNNANQKLSLVERAVIFAVSAHAGMKRKGTETPYILHPLEAAAIVATMTDDENIIAAAVLHDVLEDTPVTFGELEREFGGAARFVASETEDKREDLPAGSTWKLRKQETIEYLNGKAGRAEKVIALGDKLSNMRAIYRDYSRIGDKLWERFNQKDKKEHEWYYGSIAEALPRLCRSLRSIRLGWSTSIC